MLWPEFDSQLQHYFCYFYQLIQQFIMLNSYELSELKIEGLAHPETNDEKLKIFFQVSSIPNFHKFDHIILQDHSNANIVAFVLILLSQIFETRKQRSLSSSSKDSPNSELNSGGASVNPEKNSKSESFRGRKQEQVNGEQKLEKIYEFLFNPSIDFLNIKNIPENLLQILEKMYLTKETSGRYMKKVIYQFLQILQTKNNSGIDDPNLMKKCGQGSVLVEELQKYPVVQTLLSIFARCVLLQFYQIYEASDFRRKLSDYVVYNALCDAFNYNNSLHFEESYTQITQGFYIRLIHLKNFDSSFIRQSKSLFQSKSRYVLISLPQQYWIEKAIETTSSEQPPLKKSYQVFSTQSLSFRVSPTKKAMRMDEKGVCIQQKRRDKELRNESKQIREKPNFVNQKDDDKGIEKKKKQETLNGYTSMQLLRQLTPQVRDSMLKNINCYRKYDNK